MGALNLITPNTEKVKVFKEEGKPSAMRIYRDGSDQILIDSEGKDEYLPQSNYLGTIKDPADRALEEARINKQVEWYK